MNENIDLTKILKDCPRGTKLYSTIFGEVEFESIHNSSCSIKYKTITGRSFDVTCEGKMFADYDGECTLFPSKDQRDWSKFITPYKFKDGDIVATSSGSQVFILNREEINKKGYCYIGYNFRNNALFPEGKWLFNRLATEEEKRKFFDAIKLNGYKWNAETKTLEKLVKPKFDPKTLKPFDKVLVRDYHDDKWVCSIFSHRQQRGMYNYTCTNGANWKYCIPYNDETKHLVGTTDDAPEFYKNKVKKDTTSSALC